jgi:hypothetical protein
VRGPFKVVIEKGSVEKSQLSSESERFLLKTSSFESVVKNWVEF